MAAPAPKPRPKRLVLVGAGHAHIQLLRMHLMEPFGEPFGLEITLVVDRPVAVYSGMVPGVVAGQYRPDQVELDAWPLARLGGVRIVVAAATRIDPERKQVHCSGRPPLDYDLCSVDIGSTVRGLELPGVAEHCVPTRPINRFVERLEADLPGLGPAPQVVVVGAGAAGIELAFCMHARLVSAGKTPRIQLLDKHTQLLAGKSERLRKLVLAGAKERGIEVIQDAAVAQVVDQGVRLHDDRFLPSEMTLWVTGAKAHPLAQDSGLPTQDGYLEVHETLQVVGHPELFAAGDCCHMVDHPWVPKAGVYAVRAGPVLAFNLRAALEGRPLRPYRPQRDFLALLNLGDGSAIGHKWGQAFQGDWVFKWKDRIDLAFMDKFRVLDPQGQPDPAFLRGMPPMAEEEMVCGGCAAKVAPDHLSGALSELEPVSDGEVILGLDAADDAAALQRPTEVMVQSVDVFTAFVDEPFVVGQVAASNALSDLHATGVQPRVALALVTLPTDSDHVGTLRQVMAGVRQHLDAEGCTLMGGHTTVGEKLTVGLSVTGFAPDGAALWRNAELSPGDQLILTRPLGTGVLFHADMAGQVSGPDALEALRWMTRGNGPAARAIRALGPSGVTDVTGFGLAGHLIEMLRPKDLHASVSSQALPVLPGVLRLLAQGVRSSFHHQNRTPFLKVIQAQVGGPPLELLFDPQTAGGLLISAAPDRVAHLLEALHAAGDQHACVIGEVTRRQAEGPRITLR
ncbi:MAG: selenide, water dikinase SelD [Myxococcota bacterium]|nr:selenide, water dikinase SelD [Myxococcota bacterium]